MRTFSTIIFACVVGIGVGLGTAIAALTINAWNPELEYKKHADLVREIVRKIEDPNAKAFIENTVYDFGIKDVKEKGKQNFQIKNVGSAPLTLEVNRTTCTCTGIDLSSKRLAPGETAVATVHYDAERAMTGSYTQGGTIVTNDPDNREIFLTIKGIFTSPVVLSPNTISFPSVPSMESRSTTMRIFGYEKTPALIIESANWSDKEHFDFTFTPSELTEKEKEDSMQKHAVSVYDAKITVKPGLPIGSFQEKIQFQTNYISEPRVDFIVRGQVASSGIALTGMGFNKETGTALLGHVNVGQSLVRDISIQISGSAAQVANLKIQEVKPEWLQVSLNEPHDVGSSAVRRRFHKLTIEIPATAPVCNFMKPDEQSVALITLSTGVENAPTIKIPVQFAVVQ